MSTVILGGMKNKKSGLDDSVSYPDGDAPEADSSTALEASMESFLSAINAKDTKAMASALETFVSLCDDDAEEDYEESEA